MASYTSVLEFWWKYRLFIVGVEESHRWTNNATWSQVYLEYFVASPKMSGRVRATEEDVPLDVQEAAILFFKDSTSRNGRFNLSQGFGGLTLNEYLEKMGFDAGPRPKWWSDSGNMKNLHE